MLWDRAQLERYARELRARAPLDPAVLEELCAVYWQLDRCAEAMDSFELLLPQRPLNAPPGFDAIYLRALRATQTCPAPLRRRNRLLHLIESLKDTAKVPGEIVECGCFRGLSSCMMCTYLKQWDPQFQGAGYHIFDSFKGLSEPTADDAIPHDWDGAKDLRTMCRPGAFAASLEQVRDNLREFPQVSFHPGWIPLSFKGLPEANYRFVHVDVDLYDPTLDAFSYFYPRLSPGGAIVSDDYSWPGARTAIDEYCAEHALELEITAFNQAIVRKPSAPK